MLIFYTSIALAQIPAPQINLSGNIGCQGFPCVNNGTLIMASDANRTMTALETSAMYIKVTSSVSLTATRNLIAPAGRFNFTIENATTGGQSIQIIGASGTGITIVNGTTVAVWNDGTNFVQVGSAGGGVVSINSTPGAFIFTGSAVSCVGVTCTFNTGTGALPTASFPGQIISSTAAGTTYGVQTNIFYSQPGDTIASIETECSATCAYIVSNPQTITLAADHTLSANVWVSYLPEGLWTVNGAHTLKFTNTPTADDKAQHFAGTATLTGMSGPLRPEWWGAVPYPDTATAGAATNDVAKAQKVFTALTGGGYMELQCAYYHIGGLVITQPTQGFVGDCPAGGDASGVGLNSTVATIVSSSATETIVDAHGASAGALLSYFSMRNVALQRSVTPTGTARGLSLEYMLLPTIEGVSSADSLDLLYAHNAGNTGIIHNFIGRWGYSVVAGSAYTGTAPRAFNFDSVDGVGEDTITLSDSSVACGQITASVPTAIYMHGATISDIAVNNVTSNGCKYFADIEYTGGTSGQVNNIVFDNPVADQTLTSSFLINNATPGTHSNEGNISIIGGQLSVGTAAVCNVDIENSQGISFKGTGINASIRSCVNNSQDISFSAHFFDIGFPDTKALVFTGASTNNTVASTFTNVSAASTTNIDVEFDSASINNTVGGSGFSFAAANAVFCDGTSGANAVGINAYGASITTPVSGCGNSALFFNAAGGFTSPPSGFANPMTALGDTIYGGASGVATRLAGFTVAGTYNLCETPTGSAVAPTWCNSPITIAPVTNQVLRSYSSTTGLFTQSALASGDIPNNAANTSGTAAIATNIAGGALGSAPYQNAASTTLFIASPTTTDTYFYGWTPTGSAIAPTAKSLTTYLASPAAIGGTSPSTIRGTVITGTSLNAGGLVKSIVSSGNLATAVVSDVIAYWTGTCSSSTFLRGDGICAAPAGGGTVTTSGTPTTGFFPLFTGSTVIGNSHLDDGITNASSITSSENIIAPVLIATTNTISPSYTIQTAGTATSGANFGSVGAYGMFGSYWTGTVSNTESATFSLAAGTGSNPAYTAQLAFTGSSGFAAFSAPALIASGLGNSTSPVCPNGTNNALTTVGCTGGGGAVSSVSNSDGSLTITPTTGAVVASLSAAKNATLLSGSRSNNTIAYGESVVGGNQASLEAGNPLSTSFVGRIGFSSGGQVLNRGVSGAASNDIQKTQIYQNQSYQGVRYPLQIMMMGSNDYLSAFSPGSAQQLALFSTFHLNSMAYATIPSDSYVGDRTGNLNWNSTVSYVNGEVASSGGLNYIAVGGISGIPNLNKTPASNLNTYWVPYIPPIYFKVSAQASTTLTGTWNNDVTLVAGPTVNSVSPVLPALGSIASATGASLTVSLPNPAGDPLYLGYVKMDGNAGVASVTIDGSSPASGPTSLNAFGDSGAIIKTASQANTDGYALARWPIAATAPACTPTLSALTSNVATITCTNTFVVGQGVTFLNMTNVPFLNGTTETIASASGTAFTVAFTHANVTSAAEAVAARATPGHLVKISVTSTPTTVTITNIAIASNVVTGTCSATCGLTIGNSGYFSGVGTNTFLNGVRLTIASSSGSTFTASSTASGSTSGGWTHANVTSGADTGSFIVNWFSATWFGTYPATSTFQQFEGPNLAAMGVIPYNSQVTLSAQYNTQALADNALLQGDQAPITTIDVRNGYGNIPGLNLVTDYDAGSGPHPNDAGMVKLANMIEAQMQPPRTYNSNSTSYMQDSNPGSIGTISLSFGTYSFGTAGYSGTTPTTGVANISVKDVTASGRLFLTGLTVFTPTPTAATSYTSTSTENEIRMTNTAARSVVMGSSGTSGQTTVIKDSACTAATAPVTITVASGGTIDGFSSLVINQNCGSATINWISTGVYETKVAQALPGENVVAFSATPVFSPLFLMNTITLTGNVTSSTLAAGYPGQGMTMVVCNDATGSRTFVPPTNVKGFGTIGATPSTCNSQHIVYSLSKITWYADAAMVMNE